MKTINWFEVLTFDAFQEINVRGISRDISARFVLIASSWFPPLVELALWK